MTQQKTQSLQTEETVQDIGPLVWILREVDHSLDSARQSIRKFVLEQGERAREGGIADTSPLRSARAQLHQATGAVEVVGLPGAPIFLKALESAIAYCVDHPEALNSSALNSLERAMNALHEYLQSLSAGRKPQPLKLFANYSDVLKLSGTERIHPSDLWDYEFEWQDVNPDRAITDADANHIHNTATYDRAILHLLRGNGKDAAEQLSHVIDASYAHASTRNSKAFWAITAGVVEALSKHAIKVDDHLKRAFTRLSLQVRNQAKSAGDVSERLGRDLLFFASQAAPIAAERSRWLGALLRAYNLADSDRIDYAERHFAAVDPAILQLAHRRVNNLKQLWAELSNGDPSRIRSVNEAADLVAESIHQLNPESASTLGLDLSKLIKRCTHSAGEMTAERALEVANAVLFLEASLQSGEINGSLFNDRQSALSQRLQKSLSGLAAGAMDPWMEELYRKSSEAQTIGSVVQELKASMGNVEAALDKYFRNPNDRDALAQVPALLSQARGVMSVLGLDHAAAAIAHSRSIIEGWILSHKTAPIEQSQQVAQNLGALSFMVDLLGYQPAAAKSMFVFDPESNEFKSGLRAAPQDKKTEKPQSANELLGDQLDDLAQHLSESQGEPGSTDSSLIESKLESLKLEATIADVPHIREAASTALDALKAGDTEQAASLLLEQATSSTAAPALTSPVPFPAATTAPATADISADDEEDELLGIFLDEAREVSDGGELQIATLRQTPDDSEALVTLRRSFHTLKGSSRMVGLAAFGESAWQMEQVLNAYLAEPKPATPALLDLSADALVQLKQWITLIATDRPNVDGNTRDWPAAFTASAEAFKAGAVYFPIATELSADDLSINGVATGAVEDIIDIGLKDFEALDLIAGNQPSSPAEIVQAQPDVNLEHIQLDLTPPQDTGATHSVPSTTEASEISLDEFLNAAGVSARHDDLSASPALDAVAPVTIDSDTSHARTNSAQLYLHPAAVPLTNSTEDDFRQVGDLRLPIGLYNIYLSEADELVRKLTSELDMWRIESADSGRGAPEGAISAAHTLAGTSATVGVSSIADLGYDLEAALLACQHRQLMPTAAEHATLGSTADEMRKLLHQFAAGFIKDSDHSVASAISALRGHWTSSSDSDVASMDINIDVTAAPAVAVMADNSAAQAQEPARIEPQAQSDAGAPPVVHVAPLVHEQPSPAMPPKQAKQAAVTAIEAHLPGGDLVDSIDPDLFPIFEEEALELLPKLSQSLRAWLGDLNSDDPPKQSLRVLHTFKGSARLAGAMRLGEMAHQLESNVEAVLRDQVNTAAVTALAEQCDELVAHYDEVRAGEIHSSHEFEYHAQPPLNAASTIDQQASAALLDAGMSDQPVISSTVASLPTFKLTALAAMPVQARAQQAVRVKAGLLDRLFNQAGEVSITRARLENEIGTIKGSLGDLTDNLSRLREQLRAIELQAETQMQSRMAASKEALDFDPLEFDRFTRFQELTRMMAESVNDVATVQQSLNRTLVTTEDDLLRQARMTKELQRDLLRTRMVEFESLSERLYRVVRQVAKELNKNVRLDINGGQIEIDRGVLERMAGSFEHLLRNSVAHGIESPQQRTAAGKQDTGQITITLKQESNEVTLIFSDDGAGLNFQKIKEKALKLKLMNEQEIANESALAELIFAPGFSTAETVSEVAGRGIGMDVVKSEIQGLGGRVTVGTQKGHGTTFTLVLPLTTAVTQIVLLRMGDTTVGVPSSLVEIVQRMKTAELAERYASRSHSFAGLSLDFYPFDQLLHASRDSNAQPAGESKDNPVLVIRSAAQRVAIHVHEILGNQEVVVRNLGPQLSRVPGLAGMSVLASGAVVLIYNPVALAAVYGPSLRTQAPLDEQQQPLADATGTAAKPPLAAVADATNAKREPTVMVVDDSLTVRRVTQRLLQRNGYKVVLAKDGLDALEVLQTETPDVMLLDIEMPRMDGFDLTRNMRAAASSDALKKLPIVMITSRIADKHRTLAFELGVNHYLGKPYNEEELLSLVAQYTGVSSSATLSA